jgi:hypothetical protein
MGVYLNDTYENTGNFPTQAESVFPSLLGEKTRIDLRL